MSRQDTQSISPHRRRSSRHCTCSRSWRRSLQVRCCDHHTASTSACWCLCSCQQGIACTPSRARLSAQGRTRKRFFASKLPERRNELGMVNTQPRHCRSCTCPRRKLCSWPHSFQCTPDCRRSPSTRRWLPANYCLPDSLCTPRCREHTCICRQHTSHNFHCQGRNTLRYTRSL